MKQLKYMQGPTTYLFCSKGRMLDFFIFFFNLKHRLKTALVGFKMNIVHDINGILKGLLLGKGSLVTDIEALLVFLSKTFHYIWFLEIRNFKIFFE